MSLCTSVTSRCQEVEGEDKIPHHDKTPPIIGVVVTSIFFVLGEFNSEDYIEDRYL